MEKNKNILKAIYYPESICLNATELKYLLLLYDQILFLPPDIGLNPGQSSLSKRFSPFDSLLAGAFRTPKDAYNHVMYASESNVWDDDMKRLMDLYDELEDQNHVSSMDEDSFSDVRNFHPLKVSVDADMKDPNFVALCHQYKNRKISIPQIKNSSIKGGGCMVRPLPYKGDLSIPCLCSERLNSVLYLSGRENLFPVCNYELYIDLLKTKLKRAAVAAPKYATPPNSTNKFSMLSLDIATEVVPQFLVESKSAKEIIRYREACQEEKNRFISHLWRLEASTTGEIWDQQFYDELNKIIKMEIMPEFQKIRDSKKEIWEKLFGDSLVELTTSKSLMTLVGVHFVPGLSFWEILAFSSAAVSYAAFKPMLEAWREGRKLKRNAMFYLFNFTK